MTTKNKNPVNKHILQIISILMIITLCLTSFVGCKDKKNTPTNPQLVDKKIEKDVDITKDEDKNSDNKETANTATKSEFSSSGASQNSSSTKQTSSSTTSTPKATQAITQKVPSKTPEKSGLNNRPSTVENATSTKQLSNINPEQAANNAYDTEVSVQPMQSKTINPNEFTYVPYNEFSSHIKSVWSSLTTTEKIVIDAQYINEYLNYVCLPVKESFGEINCNGYSVMYGLDQTQEHAYMEVTWSYYVNANQYAQCRNAAAQIVNSTSGSTVERIRQIHDKIASDNTYIVNVDGAYNCLINHRSDCDGYTGAFQICMELLGIPSKAYCTTDHIFNCVKIDDKWYVVDVTFDDQTDRSGFIYTRYFLAGSSMYTNYPILTNMLSSTDYNCSRKLTVTDDAKFRTFIQIGNQNYTLNDDSTVTVEGLGTLRIS